MRGRKKGHVPDTLGDVLYAFLETKEPQDANYGDWSQGYRFKKDLIRLSECDPKSVSNSLKVLKQNNFLEEMSQKNHRRKKYRLSQDPYCYYAIDGLISMFPRNTKLHKAYHVSDWKKVLETNVSARIQELSKLPLPPKSGRSIETLQELAKLLAFESSVHAIEGNAYTHYLHVSNQRYEKEHPGEKHPENWTQIVSIWKSEFHKLWKPIAEGYDPKKIKKT